ncbi:MAG: VCBS repeat-containing protein [Agriterribacter sp.]
MLFIIFFNALFQLLGEPQPKFKEQVVDNNIWIGYGMAVGDVDGDDKPDILLADKKQFVWYRNGDWKRFVMIDNLTQHDNVCIAAKDIDGDGKVEVAVGAQWNPSETGNEQQSGAVFFLIRPDDPTQLWTAKELHHEVTTHRMKWIKSAEGKYYLVVAPLHGKDNKNGEGAGVKILAYAFPEEVNSEWKIVPLDTTLHLTHNFDIVTGGKSRGIYVASREGVKFISDKFSSSQNVSSQNIPGIDKGAGEIKVGKAGKEKNFIATVEPMHGTAIVVYLKDDNARRIVLDDNVKEGHALAVADFTGSGRDQVVAGWRAANKDGKVGVKIYTMLDAKGEKWDTEWIDENGMACEDIQVADLNGDGKPDIVASGRATKNLKIYWNNGK